MNTAQKSNATATNAGEVPVATPEKNISPLRRWLARLGIAGFMFFFLKGMVWLAIFFGVGKCVL